MEEVTAKVIATDASIQFKSSANYSWSLEFENIRLVAEATTQAGPMMEDWFVVFVDSEGKIFAVPPSTEGFESAFAKVKNRLGIQRQLTMYDSTNFSSRIMWPKQFEGKPLLEFKRVRKSAWESLTHWWTAAEVDGELSKEIQDYLRKGFSH